MAALRHAGPARLTRPPTHVACAPSLANPSTNTGWQTVEAIVVMSKVEAINQLCEGKTYKVTRFHNRRAREGAGGHAARAGLPVCVRPAPMGEGAW